MSKITNDGLTRPGIRCFIAVPMWHHWASKGSLSTVQGAVDVYTTPLIRLTCPV